MDAQNIKNTAGPKGRKTQGKSKFSQQIKWQRTIAIFSIASWFQNGRRQPNSSNGNNNLQFQDHLELGSFNIDHNGNMIHAHSKQLKSKLRPEELDLDDGFEEAEMVDFYPRIKDIKWNHCMRWITDNQLLNDNGQGNPTIIANSELLSSILLSSLFRLNFGWKIRAEKYKGSIFLHGIRTYPSHMNSDHDFNLKADRFRDLKLLNHLVADPSDTISEFQKNISIVQTSFDSKQLVLFTQIDARDKEEAVLIKAISKQHMNKKKAKYLKLYIQSVMANIRKILVGTFDQNSILKSIKPLKTDQLAPKVDFTFFKKFLDMICNYVKYPDYNYVIVYGSDQKEVSVKVVTNSASIKLLPDFFRE